MAVYSERTLPEVMQDIVANIQELIRSEFRLAKTQIKEQAAQAIGPAKALGAGIVLSFYAVGFLLLAVVYGLSTVMEMWMAALLVGVLLAVLSLALVSSSRKKLKQVRVVPDRAAESLKENIQWAKNQIK